MTHQHFKRFSYSFAGLTITYVSAVLFYFLVVGIVTVNQQRDEAQVLGTITQVDPTVSDLNQIDSSLNTNEDTLDPEELDSDDEVLGATSDDDSKDLDELDDFFKSSDRGYDSGDLD